MDRQGEHSSRVKLIAVVATVGLLSAALGFTAEATRLQLDDVKDIYGSGCIYPSHSGPTGFGVIAVIALLGFRVYCPGARSPCSVVQVARYLSWVAWFAAMSFYIVGLVMIANQGKKISYGQSESYYECNVVKPGIFGAGASFALTSIILEVVYMVVTEHLAAKTTTTNDPSTQPSRWFTMC